MPDNIPAKDTLETIAPIKPCTMTFSPLLNISIKNSGIALTIARTRSISGFLLKFGYDFIHAIKNVS
jgi:hypothetical protein